MNRVAAQILRNDGVPVADIARMFGVSAPWVYMATKPPVENGARLAAILDELNKVLGS